MEGPQLRRHPIVLTGCPSSVSWTRSWAEERREALSACLPSRDVGERSCCSRRRRWTWERGCWRCSEVRWRWVCLRRRPSSRCRRCSTSCSQKFLCSTEMTRLASPKERQPLGNTRFSWMQTSPPRWGLAIDNLYMRHPPTSTLWNRGLFSANPPGFAPKRERHHQTLRITELRTRKSLDFLNLKL